MTSFILELPRLYTVSWGVSADFKINPPLEKKRIEANQQIFCEYATMTFTLQSAEAAIVFLKMPWYKIFKHVAAYEGPHCFAEINGGVCSQALSLAMQFAANPENFFLCSKTNKVVVSLPFDFSRKNAWPLDMNCENYIKIALFERDKNFCDLEIVDATIQMYCNLQFKPTRRIVVPTKPQLWQICSEPLRSDRFSINIDQKFTPSTKIRYIYILISSTVSGEPFQGDVSIVITIEDKDVILYESKLLSCVDAWKSALCDHDGRSDAAAKLSNMPAYVWTCSAHNKHSIIHGFDNNACNNYYFRKPGLQIKIKGKFDLPPKFESSPVCIQAFIATDEVVEKFVEKFVQVKENELPPTTLAWEQLHQRVRALENYNN